MVTQPSGTVTLVFTDVEGSTRLLGELGRDAHLAALNEGHRIVRPACARHGGYEEREYWSGRWDSNPRSRAPKARALATTPHPGVSEREYRTMIGRVTIPVALSSV